MEKKLLFPSISPTAWKLLYKTLFLLAGLLLVFGDEFSFRSLFVFMMMLAIVYFSQITGRETLRFSFWSFLGLVVAGLYLLGQHPVLFASFPVLIPFIFLLSAVALFLLLGLGHFFFKDRFLIYGIFNTAELLVLFLVFQPLFEVSLWWFPVFFTIITLLFREFFAFVNIKLHAQSLVASGAVGLITTEIFFVTQFLPLGVLNAAALFTVVSLLLRDTLSAHFEGVLDRAFVMREMTILVLFTLIIFASSRWSI